MVEGPRIHEFLHEMRQAVVGDDENFVLIGETPGVTTDLALRFTDPAREELDMVFSFEHMNLDHGPNKFDLEPMQPGALIDCLARWQVDIGAGWCGIYLENHDQPRSVTRFGQESGPDAPQVGPATANRSAMALALANIPQRGTAFVYQGEEIGMINAGFTSIDQIRDVESLNYLNAGGSMASVDFMGRDNARTPMQWDATQGAGFTTGTPWIDVPERGRAINVAAEKVGPDEKWTDHAEASVFGFYRELLRLRRENPIIGTGDYQRIATDSPNLYAYQRTDATGRLIVVVNLSNENCTISRESLNYQELLLELGELSFDDTISIGPWSGFIAWA
jgi:oligo-1,6-glucosidase